MDFVNKTRQLRCYHSKSQAVLSVMRRGDAVDRVLLARHVDMHDRWATTIDYWILLGPWSRVQPPAVGLAWRRGRRHCCCGWNATRDRGCHGRRHPQLSTRVQRQDYTTSSNWRDEQLSRPFAIVNTELTAFANMSAKYHRNQSTRRLLRNCFYLKRCRFKTCWRYISLKYKPWANVRSMIGWLEVRSIWRVSVSD